MAAAGSADVLSDANQVKATFTVRKAGQYYIDLYIGHTPIVGSPFVKNFMAGPPVASTTSLVRPTSMAVCTAGTAHQVVLEPRDEFANPCAWAHDAIQQQTAFEAFTLESFRVGCVDPLQPQVHWLWVEVMHRLLIQVTFADQGIYLLRVKFHQSLLNKGELNVIVLSKTDQVAVEKTLTARSLPIYYEARMTSINGDKCSKARKVYCALTPKQLAIKDYILGFIPKRLATFRLCPSTKVHFSCTALATN